MEFFDEEYFTFLITSYLPKFLQKNFIYNLKRFYSKYQTEFDGLRKDLLRKDVFSNSEIQRILKSGFKNFRGYNINEVYHEINSTDYFNLLNIDIKTNDFTFTGSYLKITESSTVYEIAYKKDSFINDFCWLEFIPNLEVCINILDIFLTTKKFAKEFNRRIDQLGYNIHVSNTILLRNENLFFLVNQAYQNISNSVLKFTNEHDILDAFSHFTYLYSNKNLVIFDLRSFVQNTSHLKASIILTEPVIFSKSEKRFSSSNLGRKGLEKIAQEHKCNHFCRKIFYNLPSVNIGHSTNL